MNPLKTDARFWILSEALASYASDADDPPVRDADTIQAAVALVLRGGGEDLELLLIKRARSERDPWSGHMALPGGRRDDDDPSLRQTSIRETREETGVDLDVQGAFLGALDAVVPGSVQLPSLTISPFVYGTLPGTEAHVASAEIAQVYWVPLDELRDPAVHGQVEINLPGGERSFPCYRVAGEVVWGLTYRILEQFLERYPDGELGRLAKR